MEKKKKKKRSVNRERLKEDFGIIRICYMMTKKLTQAEAHGTDAGAPPIVWQRRRGGILIRNVRNARSGVLRCDSWSLFLAAAASRSLPRYYCLSHSSHQDGL